MKSLKYFLLIVLSVFLVSSAYTQTYNPDKKFPVSQLEEDFINLRKLIEDNHPALYRYYDEAYFKNYFDSVYSLINREMTELEFIKILEPMVAKVHCGHTELWYSENFQNYIYANGLFIPLSIHYIDNRAYIIRDYTENYVLTEGSEIILINDVPVSQILKTLYAGMNGDGFNKQNILFTINKSPVSTLSKYFNYTDSYTIQFTKPGEKNISTVTLEGIKYQKLVSVLNKRYNMDSENRAFSFKILDSLNTAVIAIRSFVMRENDNYYEFLKSSFNQIDSQNIQNLIVDVRGNDGGHPDYSIDLLRYLMNKDFVYFKTKVSNEKWNTFIKPHKNNFKGNIYILINGGELSTTGHFISLVKYHNIGTFIGRESGSTFSCHDNSLRFVLPNTKIGGKVARNTFETAVNGLSWEKGIMPHHYVEPNLKDLINGVDTIMEYALNLIKHSKTSGGGP